MRSAQLLELAERLLEELYLAAILRPVAGALGGQGGLELLVRLCDELAALRRQAAGARRRSGCAGAARRPRLRRGAEDLRERRAQRGLHRDYLAPAALRAVGAGRPIEDDHAF